jgi:hypothetical protein
MKNTVTKNSTAACTLLLATSSAFAGPTKTPSTTDRSNIPATPPKIQFTKSGQETPAFGINAITVTSSGKKLQNCEVPKGVTRQTDPKPHRILSLAIPMRVKESVNLKFDMSDIDSSKEQRILVVLYNTCLSKSPEIQTPNSDEKLALSKEGLAVLANYPVAPITPATGNKGSNAKTKISFDVSLDTDFMAQQLRAGNDTFYLQAALLPKAEFDKHNYQNVQLSKLEAIQLTANKCPKERKLLRNLNSDNKACKK